MMERQRRRYEDRAETLCATCTRAYARPDPAGCAFHRRDYVTREIEGHPYSRAKMVYRSQGDTPIIVLECEQYQKDQRWEPTGYVPLTDEQREAAYQLRQQGLTFKVIGRRLGCAANTARTAYYRRCEKETIC